MKVLTANRLIDGEAVWYAAGVGWQETIDNAEIARGADAQARLEAIGNAAYADNKVIDVALIDIDPQGDAIVPARLRERIRAAGPTNRLDLGKQARPETNRSA